MHASDSPGSCDVSLSVLRWGQSRTDYWWPLVPLTTLSARAFRNLAVSYRLAWDRMDWHTVAPILHA